MIGDGYLIDGTYPPLNSRVIKHLDWWSMAAKTLAVMDASLVSASNDVIS